MEYVRRLWSNLWRREIRNFDVIGLVIRYLKPFQLVPFFRAHGLAMDKKFKYDTSRNCLSVWEFRYVMGHFKNVVIVGVGLKFEYDEARVGGVRGCRPRTFVISLNRIFTFLGIIGKLDCVKRINLTRVCGEMWDKHDAYYDMSALQTCYNLVHLRIQMWRVVMLRVRDKNVLAKCSKLKSVNFVHSICDDWSFITLLPNLKSVGMSVSVKESVKDYYRWILRSFIKMKHLELYGCDKLDIGVVGKYCVNLRSLIIDTSFVDDVADLIGLKKLRYVKLRACVMLQSVEGLGSVRHLVVDYCNYMNFASIGCCSRLKSVKIESCDLLDNELPVVQSVGLFGCRKLKSLVVPCGIRLLCVDRCYNLKNISVEESLESFESFVVAYDCPKLLPVGCPNDVKLVNCVLEPKRWFK